MNIRGYIKYSRATRVVLVTLAAILAIGGRGLPAAPIGVISEQKDPTRWTITTANSTYQVILNSQKELVAGYYGSFSGVRVHDAPRHERIQEASGAREVPYRGGFVNMTPSLEVIFADHTRELELVYDGHEVGVREGFPFIRFDLKDTHYPFRVSEYIRIFPKLDILEKWLVLRNDGDDEILVERAYSGSVVLPPGAYDMIHLSGEWGREFYPRRTQLTSGLKSIFVRGVRSHQHASHFMVRPTGDIDEDVGPVWFGAVAWSGNWRIDCDVTRMERTQITGGINPWDTHWVLEGNSQFETPKMIFGFSTDGSNGASRRMHRYILDHVLRKPFSEQVNKVLYNSWYATTFNVNEDDQVALAKIAKGVGVELFVMDDGWFKGRKTDRAGLGDWTPDRDKFPNGLGPMIQKINALGMDFGIWVEPEMVNPDSDLFRAHPEWALHTPYRTAHEQRNQLVLNFARNDVKEYTLEWMDDLLSKNNIKFIKWDMNRYISEGGWPEMEPRKQREMRIRYAKNVMQVLRTLREKHPDVIFECCSGGGGRANPGILAVTDQIWTSDNTDAGDRLHIQYGFSHAFPAKTMVNWVTDSEWHNKKTSLKFRFHVAMAGSLGVGCNLHDWTDEDKKVASGLIEQYKSVRHIIQLGDQYRLVSPFERNRMAVQFVTRDGSESVLFAYQTLETLPAATGGTFQSDVLVLHGLDPGAYYLLEGHALKEPVSGAALMKAGLDVPLRGNYTSKMITLRKVD